MREKNFSLLSQNEIDTLLDFIKKKYEGIESEVLDQNSIDKLIWFLQQHDKSEMQSNLAAGKQKERNAIAGLKEGVTHILSYHIEDKTGYLQLYVTELGGEEAIKLSPVNFQEGSFQKDDSQWGYSIAPILFNEIAATFQLKFSKETYEELCFLYAEKNFGDKNYPISNLFLAREDLLKQNLL